MARKGIKVAADEVIIYAVYSKEDLPVIVGTIQEIADYLGITKNYVYTLACQSGRYKNSKYAVYRIGTEKIKERRCSICGKVKPFKEFAIRKKVNGKTIYCACCRSCKREHYGKRKNEVKTNG